MVKNPPSNARDAGSIPGRGTKILHAAGQRSLYATTTELACSRGPHAAMKDAASCNEDPMCRN